MAAIAVLATAACGRGARTPHLSTPEIRTNENTAGTASIDVIGLPDEDLRALRARSMTAEDWTALLRVAVDRDTSAADVPPVSGSYAVAGDALRFVPSFPLDHRVAH